MQHKSISLNNINIHVVVAGSGPCVLLLHGFPEFWYSWRNQIRSLSANFTVIAPDLRGYGRSSAPKQVSDYDQDVLIQDVLAIARHFSPTHPISVIGHDWGAALGYLFCIKYPAHVSRFVALSFPHPIDFKNALISWPSQMRRSWYIFFFQLPWLPEIFLTSFHFFFLRTLFYKAWSGKSKPLSQITIHRYIANLRRHRYLKTAIHYYRAIFRHKSTDESVSKIFAPTLVIFGENDPLVSPRLLEEMKLSKRHFSGRFEFQIIPNAGHWLQQEQPKLTTKLIAKFLE